MTRAHFFTGASSIFLLSLADGALKWWAISHATPANSASIPPLIAFALHKNPGIAFDIPVPFFIILPLTFVIILLFGSYFGRKAFHEQKLGESLACAMICFGALGNFVDRCSNGFTTDYLILLRTSAINISDLLILIGMGLFLWYHKSVTPQIEKT